jgi:hypothetical protein
MKSSELRLLNLVEYPNWNNDGSKAYFKIRDIYFDDGRIGLTNGSIIVPGSKLEYLKPILLTEEWLLKFGFSKRDVLSSVLYDMKNPRFSIYLNPPIDKSNKWNILGIEKNINIQYVHQLQNLYFALTGEELTIKQQEQ